MLAVRVVHEHHREPEDAGAVHRLEAQDAGGRLLAAADHVRDQLRELLVHQRHQVTAIVDDDVRAHLQHAAEVLLVLVHRGAVDGEHVQPGMDQSGRHVVLRGQRIAARGVHVGAAGGQAQAQARRLRLHVDAQRDFHAGKRLRFDEILLDAREQGHVVPDPLDLQRAALPQVDVSDMTGHKRFVSRLQSYRIPEYFPIFAVHLLKR